MKKLLTILLVGAMLLGLAACGGDKGGQQANNGGGTDGEKKETLVMATNAEFPPYEYWENNAIVGIDAEVAAAIADKLGMELRIDDMAFDATLVALQSGQANMVMAGMTVTPERQESVNFSEPYAEAHQVIIVKEDSTIATVEDLAGKKIGVQTNTTGDIYITDDLGDEAVARFNRGADAVMDLKNDKVDAVVIDLEPAKAFVAANEGLKILETEYATEEYAIAINKNDTELLEKVNTALQELKDDGTLQQIIDTYIPAE